MKNIFRILSVALVAGSMLFVACGKEDDPVTPTPSNPTDTTSTPTTPTDTTPVNPPAPAAPIVVTLDGTATEYTIFMGAVDGDELISVIAENAAAVSDTTNMNYIYIWGRKTVGTFPYDATAQNPWIQIYEASAVAWTSGSAGAVGETVTAVDLNAHTLTATFTGSVFANDVEKTISVAFTDAEWTPMGSKSVPTKIVR